MRNLRSKVIAMALVLSATVAVVAAEPPAEKYDLSDGSTLFVHPDGTMRMINVHGKPMSMKDDVEMELKDGRMMMMKNKTVWITVGPPSKSTTFKKPD